MGLEGFFGIAGVSVPGVSRSFIVRYESFGLVSPLQFIHGPLAHNIVVSQLFNRKTFGITYVKDRLVNRDGRGSGGWSGTELGASLNFLHIKGLSFHFLAITQMASHSPKLSYISTTKLPNLGLILPPLSLCKTANKCPKILRLRSF